MRKNGMFVLSLDFELFWGVRDKYSFEEYGENVLGVWRALPRMLDLFDEYDVNASFATVAALFSSDLDELKEFLPKLKPAYEDSNLSPYNGYIEGSVNQNKMYYYGNELIELIRKRKKHEIGSHTFSHFYCLEPGQNIEEFEADTEATMAIAKKKGIQIKSFIFPRHQINRDYLKILSKYGIEIYRDTEKAWFHSPARGAEESILKRGIRYLDYFIWMGSHHCQDLSEIKKDELYAIRASRWLRPYRKSEKILDFLKIRRIKKQMEYAAKKGKIFHLWFHPHDIGIHQDINFKMLEEILIHYKKMNKKHGMKSLNMEEVVDEYKKCRFK